MYLVGGSLVRAVLAQRLTLEGHSQSAPPGGPWCGGPCTPNEASFFRWYPLFGGSATACVQRECSAIISHGGCRFLAWTTTSASSDLMVGSCRWSAVPVFPLPLDSGRSGARWCGLPVCNRIASFFEPVLDRVVYPCALRSSVDGFFFL